MVSKNSSLEFGEVSDIAECHPSTCEDGERLMGQMYAWELGMFQMLVKDTQQVKEADDISFKQGNTTPDQQVKIFNSKMLRGDIRGAIRYLTEKGPGRTLFPNDTDEKSGDTALETLESKHPDANAPEASTLTPTPRCPTSL
jgi:hypothetical protein